MNDTKVKEMQQKLQRWNELREREEKLRAAIEGMWFSGNAGEQRVLTGIKMFHQPIDGAVGTIFNISERDLPDDTVTAWDLAEFLRPKMKARLAAIRKEMEEL